MITPAQCRAGRALIDWTKDKLADAANVSARTISDFERGKRIASDDARRALEAAFFEGGVLLVGEDEAGVGVRLKFTRREVKAIDVMENEGGPTGEDDQLPR